MIKELGLPLHRTVSMTEVIYTSIECSRDPSTNFDVCSHDIISIYVMGIFCSSNIGVFYRERHLHSEMRRMSFRGRERTAYIGAGEFSFSHTLKRNTDDRRESLSE